MSAGLMKNWQDVFARVRGALQRRGQTEHEAEDLVQEAWLRLVRYEDERQPVDQPEAFLMRAALNLSIDVHRTAVGRGEHVLLEDVLLIDTTPSIEAVVLARERMARLTLGVGRLTERTREIFIANRIDGLTPAEIADRYGIGVATVHQHLAKATLRLTEWMEGW
ncbi:RNA polymerase sigma factor [Roseateles cellulosilyticus]|uniref:Sigma-70 family RNA polymerase sigma factor n=1 Tax=Pelomonas cellulosilytica TaxID=2906762 RepID=A0ABS8XXJ9_9BURK|nr:sigma-70 family RNA polymerase sigma factor [Pelomonas sp. P8]MCE4557374.1 sigma-70 family RNA polymerase sigma factor [Pelomonas sp. P8]